MANTETMNRVTDRQRAILDTIRTYTAAHGFPPTIREIGLQVGIHSTNGVVDHLRALERKGLIERTATRSRSIRILREVPATPPADPAETLRDAVQRVLGEYNVLAARADGRLETDLAGAIARRLTRDGVWMPFHDVGSPATTAA
jgi:SOS-response transcriptional repressor LexA